MPRESATTRALRWFRPAWEISRNPATETNPNSRSASPPRTAGGIAVTQRATDGRSPSIARIAAIQRPTWRLATPVIWMTPLFWAYVVLGNDPIRADAMLVRL